MLEGTCELVCDVCGWEHEPALQRLRYGLVDAPADWMPEGIRVCLDRRRVEAMLETIGLGDALRDP